MKYFKAIIEQLNQNSEKGNKNFGKRIVNTEKERQRIRQYNKFQHTNSGPIRSKVTDTRVLYIRADDISDAARICGRVKFSHMLSVQPITYDEYMIGIKVLAGI